MKNAIEKIENVIIWLANNIRLYRAIKNCGPHEGIIWCSGCPWRKDGKYAYWYETNGWSKF